MLCVRSIWHIAIVAVFVSCLSVGGGLKVSLTRVSTLKLPTYTDHNVTYSLDSATLEQLAFDPDSKLIYGVGNGIVHIVDGSNVSALAVTDVVRIPELDLTDVEVCGQGVFITYVNKSDLLHGGLLVYKGYNATTRRLEILHDIKLGSLPDMVFPTSDCTVVVAIENEGVIVDGQFYDPRGCGYHTFSHGIAATPVVKTLDFTKFNNQFDQLSKSGVRWIYRNNNSFSDNIEPEYVTYNQDYTKAYICLQENNAIATVDLTTDNITHIYGLGFKTWRHWELDPSDKDGGINLRDWPIYGMYQPDSIHWVRWNSEDYILTANEGDSMEYGGDAMFNESLRGYMINPSEFASSVSEEMRQAFADQRKLGRLIISNVDGKNSEGKFEDFYTYGGRSFSIWRASDMSLVYDSGSDLAHRTQITRPALFNNDVIPGSTVNAAMDKRSDNKGAEPEGLAVAELGGHLLIFVGLERPGTIAVYSVASSGEMSTPQFQQLFTEGIPQGREGDMYQQIYDDGQLFALDPEYIQ